ncbi:MAG: outer membrane beta-barrel protein [Gemmatimonadaceae bacterium]
MRTTRLAFPAGLLSSLLVTMNVTVLAAPAWAQGLPGAELFAGYSYLRIDAGADPGGLFSGETRGLHGAEASLTVRLGGPVGLRLGASYHHKAVAVSVGEIALTAYEYLAGLQLAPARVRSVKPFVYAMAGIAKLEIESELLGVDQYETGLAGAVGGGIDIRLGSRIDLRLLEIDYNQTRLFDGKQHNYRAAAGLVLH